MRDTPCKMSTPQVGASDPPFASEFIIRTARRQDAKPIGALWQALMDFHRARDPRFEFAPSAMREFEQHLIQMMRSRGARVYVAEAAGEVIGYTMGEIHTRKPIYPVGTYGFISDVVVDEAWRRKGVGRALAETLMAWFRQHGVTAIELFVAVANPVSDAFWRSLGFTDYLRLLRLDIRSADDAEDRRG